MMSRQYDEYLAQHKANVAKAYQWLCDNLPEKVGPAHIQDAEWRLVFNHDTSKSDPKEYDAYDAYFYGENRSYIVVQNFNKAWLHHIHNNPHHWQHWVLINDDPNEGEIILDMPYCYIIEMICDWWAFSFAKGKLDEIFGWYDSHKKYMKLSQYTLELVENILDSIKIRLGEGNV